MPVDEYLVRIVLSIFPQACQVVTRLAERSLSLRLEAEGAAPPYVCHTSVFDFKELTCARYGGIPGRL
jgi:hypothetical protein